MNEEEVLVGRIQDLAEQCYHRDVPSHTEFLTLAEQDLFYRTVNKIPGVRYVLSGGYEAAERKAALFLPSYAEDGDASMLPITVGIGCKKNTPAGRMEEKVLAALAAAGISPKAVRQAASIDLKAQEPGILQLVEKYGWQYRTFSAEELETAEGEFTPSPFVKKITGIDNVCERSAVLAGGRLIKKKKAADGVTVALAAADWRAVF